jgi:hypothetical protein
MASLLLTMLQAAGVNASQFADASAPIEQLLA